MDNIEERSGLPKDIIEGLMGHLKKQAPPKKSTSADRENKIIDGFVENLSGMKHELIPIVLKCRCGLQLGYKEFETILHELDIDYENVLEVKVNHCPRGYGDTCTKFIGENDEPIFIECRIYKPRNMKLQELLGGHDVRIWNVSYVWFDEFDGYIIYEGI